MQQPFIKLKEVIWELTDECKNGCTYCGSKDVLNGNKFNEENAIEIAKTLADIGVDEVNFSGGDPLLVPISFWNKLDSIFNKDTKKKIVCNPLSTKVVENSTIGTIFSFMDVVGLSVNTLEELDRAGHLISYLDNNFPGYHTSFTIITNFNLNNIFDFAAIEEYVLAKEFGWQVQFTIDDKIGLYNNENAVKDLFAKLDNHFANNERDFATFVADNMSSAPCGAGMYGVGILSNGDVVPCLSMRSYYKKMPTMGNLLEETMYDIWTKGFAEWRCCEFKCCKDACLEYAYEPKFRGKTLSDPVIESDVPDVIKWIPPVKYPDLPNQVIMYGVQPSITSVYAVQEVPRYPKINLDISDSMKSVYGVRPKGDE